MVVKQGEVRAPASAKNRTREVVLGPGKVPVQLQVNGNVYYLNVEPRRTLLDAIRDDLHLTGTKKVCDMGECGACTVLLDGKPVYSCLLLVIDCQGQQIITIEGLSDGTQTHPIQQAFIDHEAFQCGFCTPGQIMSLHGYLENNPDPSAEELRSALSGNICRCGAYPRILAAAEAAAKAHARERNEKVRTAKNK